MLYFNVIWPYYGTIHSCRSYIDRASARQADGRDFVSRPGHNKVVKIVLVDSLAQYFEDRTRCFSNATMECPVYRCFAGLTCIRLPFPPLTPHITINPLKRPLNYNPLIWYDYILMLFLPKYITFVDFPGGNVDYMSHKHIFSNTFKINSP